MVTTKSLLAGPFREPLPALGPARWRYAYARLRCGRFQHLVVLQAASDLDDAAVLGLARAMRENAALQGLRRGLDYQWGGVSTLALRSRRAAAAFLLGAPAGRA